MTPRFLSAPADFARAAAAGVDPAGFFRRHATTEGPIRLRFPGLGTVIFFGSSEAAREVMTIPTAACEAPTPNPIEAVLGSGSLILLSGEHHRRERSLLQPAFQGERIKEYGVLIAEATAEEIHALQPGDNVDAHALSVAITLHIVIRVVFGVADAERRRSYVQAITDLMRSNTAALMMVPALRRRFGGRGPWARLVQLRDELDQLLSDDMTRDRTGCPAGADMLDILLAAAGPDGRSPELALHDQLRTLLAAGHETTATSMAWALHHIYRDEQVLDQVTAELAGCGTPADMTTLPYLGAVIKEAMRMHPPVPIVLRRLTQPLTVGGAFCSAGDVVGIGLHALHFNPALWADPDTFDPQRFLKSRPSPFQYAPFGGGFRRCIGASFAMNELAIAVGTIVSSLDLRMSPEERRRREPRSAPRGIAMSPNRPMLLEVHGRHPAAAVLTRQ